VHQSGHVDFLLPPKISSAATGIDETVESADPDVTDPLAICAMLFVVGATVAINGFESYRSEVGAAVATGMLGPEVPVSASSGELVVSRDCSELSGASVVASATAGKAVVASATAGA
jgi:hypothetical protein